MREIKFRAWNKTQSKMFTQLYMSFGGKIGMWNYEETEIEFADYPFLELMQYTGLKDKTGKEIYEGDIVKMLSRTFTQVYFSDGGFCVDVGGQLVGLHPDFLGRYRTVEVVGNIYENPELLGDQK